MMLPFAGRPSTELEGHTKRSSIKSFPSNLTPLRRTVVFIVILFQVSLVLYLTRINHFSLSKSHQVSPAFQARESRILSKISSKTYSTLPKKALSKISSKTYGTLPNQGISKTHGSLPSKDVLEVSSATQDSLPSKDASEADGKDAPEVSSATQGSLPSKDASEVSSATQDSLPSKDVSEVSTATQGSLPSKDVLEVSSATQDSLPSKDASEANGKDAPEVSSATQGSLPSKDVTNIASNSKYSYGSLPKKDVVNVSSETHNRLPNKGTLKKISSKTHGSLPNKGCDSGRIYVYDLPPTFNYELMNKCDQLEPPDNECARNLNDGLGPQAKEYAGILPESILPALYWTNIYWGEVLFHNRMLHHKCRTLEPESAAAFYIPFYAALDVRKYLFNHTARERDMLPEMLTNWIQKQKWWKRSNGSDHFIMLGRMTWDFRRLGDNDADWGNRFLHIPAMQNVIRLSVERSIWDNIEVAVPYPTVFHPRSESDITEWQEFVRTRQRNHLFAFVGKGRSTIKNDFRGILQKQCLNEPTACRQVDCGWKNCSDGKTVVMEAFLDSDFCLQPRGDGFTRRSVFDCMLAGSIPVFFWRRTAYLQYELFLPVEPESYSVFIRRNDVRNRTDVRKVLEGFGREEVERMREKVIECIPRFVYARPSQGLEKTRDGFDVAVDGVLTKYKAHMETGRIKNWNEM